MNLYSLNKVINPNFAPVKAIGHGAGILWKIFFLLNFTISLLILYPLFYLFLTKEKFFKVGFKLMRMWGRYLLLSNGVLYWSQWKSKLPPPPYIICANHTSYLDILITYALIPDYFVFMGKQELGSVPIFNVFFKKMNILVDRKSKTGAARSLVEAAREIDKGHGLAIFPEGTISRKAPEMIPFKNGPFKLAVDKQVPIVPITYMNGWKILQDAAFLKAKSRPGTLRAIIHPPIWPKGKTEEDLLTLKQEVFDVIELPLRSAK